MSQEELEIFDPNEDYDSDENEDISESEYDPKSEFKKPMIAMMAVQACRENRAKEMIKGFWNNKLDKQGNSVRTWVSDERKIFINSVIALEKFLSPECRRDKLFQKEKKEIDSELDKLFDTYSYTLYDYDDKSGGWKKTEERLIPQIDEELLVPSLSNPRVLNNVRGGWNHKINIYYDKAVPIYDRLFEELCNVIDRLNDFGMKTTY